VAPLTSIITTPLQSSSISSLIQSSGGTNQAIQDVLHGESQSLIEVCSSPLFSTLNLVLRRLLVPDVLQLQVDDKIVLVLSTTSHLLPLYKGAILQGICQNDPALPQISRLQVANKTLQK
jgi:hypothetical protein